MNPLIRSLLIAGLGVSALFLFLPLPGCASGSNPVSTALGNMSWDRKTYTIDESNPKSILAFIEWLSLGNAMGIPLDQMNEEQAAAAHGMCGNVRSAGLILNRRSGRMNAACMNIVSESTMKSAGFMPMLKERGWEYKGKFGTKHVFVLTDGKKNA